MDLHSYLTFLPAVTPLLMVDGGYNFTWMWLPLQTGPFPSIKREFIGLRIFLRSGFYIHLVWLPWVCWKQCYDYSTWNCVNGYCSSPFHVHHWHDFQAIPLPFLGLRNEEPLSAIDLGGTSCRCVDVWCSATAVLLCRAEAWHLVFHLSVLRV